MNITHRSPVGRSRLAGLLVALSLAGVTARAAESTAKIEEPVVLSPFEVRTDLDRGFIASSSLAGGRLATDLKDTPAAYSVLTRDVMDVLNLNSLTDLAMWAPNMVQLQQTGVEEAFGNLTQVGVRGGIGRNDGAQRDFFPFNTNFDSYNLERFDIGRGPNSILFGAGGLDGATNSVTKRARIGKGSTQLRLTAGSWENYRGTLDVNRPIGRIAAVRVNLLAQDAGGWRDHEFDRRKSASLALAVRPTERTDVYLSSEYGEQSRSISLTQLADRLSGWDGRSTFTARLATVPANANAIGITRLGNNYVVLDPTANAGQVLNWALMAQTLGGNNSAAVPVGGQLVPGASVNLAGQSLLETQNLPGSRFDAVIAGSKFRLPSRQFNPTADFPLLSQRVHNTTLTVTQRVGERLFTELSANFAEIGKRNDFVINRGFANQYIDINQNLPTGAANPHYLEPYFEGNPNISSGWQKNYNARAAVGYVLDRTRFGTFRFNTIAGSSNQDSTGLAYAYVLERNADPRFWPSELPVRYRYYWDNSKNLMPKPSRLTYVDPVTGLTQDLPADEVVSGGSRSINRYNYLQAAANARLFNDRLILLVAGRRDIFRLRGFNGLNVKDTPVNWSAKDLAYKPAATAEYFNLKYQPKDANGNITGASTTAATRPRDANGFPLAQYANDRFQDDYSSPTVYGGKSTYSTGAVVHMLSWLSVYGNLAQTFSPPGAVRDVYSRFFEAVVPQSWDAGIRFHLFNGGLVGSLNRYRGHGTGVIRGDGTDGNINTIYQANAVGDLSSTGRNIRGMTDLPGGAYDRVTNAFKGYEFELTANLSRSFRLLFNAARPEVLQSDKNITNRGYLAQNETVIRQILADAGVLIDGNNVARVNPAIPGSQLTSDASNAANAWNTIMTVRASDVQGKQIAQNLVKYTMNVYGDYTVGQGRLKGLRLGGGANFRGTTVIGFRGADTIRDPANPAVAIDDPKAGPTDPVTTRGYFLGTLTLGYPVKIARRLTMNLDLRVSNLFNYDKVIYTSTAMRPPGGDLSNPARVATPTSFSYIPPRSYTLGATINF